MQEIKNILITGYKGFIGSHLATYLTDKGYNVTGIDRVDGNEVLNLTEENIFGVDAVIHLAGQTSVWNKDYEKIVDDNMIAFTHIYDLCKKIGKKFIYASSSCAINVTSAYGLSKLFQDKYANGYGVGLRFHNVYGKNSRKDTLFGRCLESDNVILHNNGCNRRHFTYIGDVCEAVETALTIEDGLYNVVNEQENSTLEFANEIAKYKELKIELFDGKRELDKERQIIDDSHLNILKNPTNITDGVRLVFE